MQDANTHERSTSDNNALPCLNDLGHLHTIYC